MQLIIFDFDGVVADSEGLANQSLAEGLTALGSVTSPEEAMKLYMGRRWADCLPVMEQRLGRALPKGFIAGQIAQAQARLLAEVQPVSGVREFLERHERIPRCIASSATLDYIAQSLDRMALTHWFEHRFSGHDVERGKPHPDLFLKAAAAFQMPSGSCVVIEDSPIGVMAGKAAGMLTIGLCAGCHAHGGHADTLIQAGADVVVSSYPEIDDVISQNVRRGQAN